MNIPSASKPMEAIGCAMNLIALLKKGVVCRSRMGHEDCSFKSIYQKKLVDNLGFTLEQAIELTPIPKNGINHKVTNLGCGPVVSLHLALMACVCVCAARAEADCLRPDPHIPLYSVN